MRFVTDNSKQAQLGSVIRRIRTDYIRQSAAVMKLISSIFVEFGFSFPRSLTNMKRLFQWLTNTRQSLLPLLVFELREQLNHYNHLNEKIKEQDKKIETLNDDNGLFILLQSIISPMTAACFQYPIRKTFLTVVTLLLR